MKRTIPTLALLAAPLLLAGCDNPEPPPAKVEVDVTIRQEPKKPHPPKGTRDVIVGDEKQYLTPFD